jgi:hypothetical protein
MSTGNPNLNPQSLQKTPEKIKEIPLSWFLAMGPKAGGISSIRFSDEFDNLGGEELKKHVGQYSHFMGNSFVADSRKLVENSSQIQNLEHRAIVELAEKKIKEITGFTAKEIWDKKSELYNLYKGKQEADIAVELL